MIRSDTEIEILLDRADEAFDTENEDFAEGILCTLAWLFDELTPMPLEK